LRVIVTFNPYGFYVSSSVLSHCSIKHDDNDVLWRQSQTGGGPASYRSDDMLVPRWNASVLRHFLLSCKTCRILCMITCFCVWDIDRYIISVRELYAWILTVRLRTLDLCQGVIQTPIGVITLPILMQHPVAYIYNYMAKGVYEN